MAATDALVMSDDAAHNDAEAGQVKFTKVCPFEFKTYI
jgi:hypothetical protein